MENHLVLCDCGTVEHQLIYSYDPDDLLDRYIFVNVHLSYGNFWQRLTAGIKYIFGHRSRYGHFDEILVSRNDAAALARFLSEFCSSNLTEG